MQLDHFYEKYQKKIIIYQLMELFIHLKINVNFLSEYKNGDYDVSIIAKNIIQEEDINTLFLLL